MFENLNLRYLILNALIFLGATTIPLYLVALSNKHVFPSTLTMANGFLLMSLAAALACMVVVAHRGADGRTIVGAIIGEILLGLVLWWNIGGHWQLSREYDAAQAGVRESREEQEIQDKREKERAALDKSLSETRQKELEAKAKLAKMEAINNDSQARLARATGISPIPRRPARDASLATPTPTPVSTARTIRPSGTPRPIPPTPAEVQQAWMPTLTTRAYLEAGAAILVLISLGVLWHIDFDRDGVSDRIQQLPRQIVQEMYPADYEKLYGADTKALPETATASLPSAPAQAAFTPPPASKRESGRQTGAGTRENHPKDTPDPGGRKGARRFRFDDAPTEDPRELELGTIQEGRDGQPWIIVQGSDAKVWRLKRNADIAAHKSKPVTEPPNGSPDFDAPQRREGKDQILFGLRFPDIPGVRYESKKKTGVIEYWGTQAHRGSRIGQFGKREVIRLAGLSDGERGIEAAAAIANKIAEKGGISQNDGQGS